MVRPPEAQPFRETRPFWNSRHQRGFHRALRGGFGGDLRRREGVRNGHPSNSGRQLPTLNQSRQRELVRVLANWFGYL